MERFGRKNLFTPISVDQFKDTAIELIEALNSVRDDLDITMSLTTNGNYYHGIGSLTVITDETKMAREDPDNQPTIVQLHELDKQKWDSAYLRQLSIHSQDETSYMICLSNEERHEGRLLFYGQSLDAISNEVYNSLRKKDRILQILDDGFPSSSGYALTHAMLSLGK